MWSSADIGGQVPLIFWRLDELGIRHHENLRLVELFMTFQANHLPRLTGFSVLVSYL